MNWQLRLHSALEARRAGHTLRRRSARSAETLPPFIERKGQTLLNFGGNDYLGLSRDAEIIAAWQRALAKYGTGSTGSPLVCGHTETHEAFENELAEWLGYECALLFASGFAANQALLLGLLGKEDVFLADKLCHASMQEAAALSGAVFRRFPHQNHDALAKLLVQYPARCVLVGSEGVFSMDGDCADIGRLKTLAEAHGAWLVIDDAHGIGVLGSEGRGSAAAAGVQPDILVVTFGKAFGSMGAAVLCSRDTADYLVQFARHLVYSTAVPPAQAAALSAALRRIRQADGLRSRLRGNIALFREIMAANGFGGSLMPSETAIQPLICGSNQTALDFSAALEQQGCYAPAIRPPTVPPKQARLRITLSAAHQESHIMQLCESLAYAAR
ncbi:MAG: 8-amino-7-oxononanoate synthase [Neisseria sp.]|nr:8-amino-7-oxononanoate synthase [Neisseria sp.]